jgi:predicted transcriptional regulator
MYNKMDWDKDMDMLAILRMAVCSDLRRNLLISLNEGKKSLGDLRDKLQISSSTAIHALRELEKNDLASQDENRDYLLTSIGRIIALKLLDFSNAAVVLEKNKRFWTQHDLTGIPDYLLEKIGWLRDSKIIHIDTLDIIKAHSSYINLIKTVKWIRGISPIFSPDYPTVFKELIERNIDTKIILTDAVLKKLINTVGLENLKNAINNYSLDLLITDENLKVASTATDTFLSLGLFTNDGVYDVKYDLISTDESAIRWGVELFEYYNEKATPVELGMFKDS